MTDDIIPIRDSRGIWKRLPRRAWVDLVCLLRADADKVKADIWLPRRECLAAELRAYADRIEAELTT